MYALLQKIPKGKVMTYSGISLLLGNKNLARAVGGWLNKNQDPDGIPCYKIVGSDGTIGGYALGKNEKIKRLQQDGIQIQGETIIDFERVVYRGGSLVD